MILNVSIALVFEYSYAECSDLTEGIYNILFPSVPPCLSFDLLGVASQRFRILWNRI